VWEGGEGEGHPQMQIFERLFKKKKSYSTGWKE
jgi:hypothetical protein